MTWYYTIWGYGVRDIHSLSLWTIGRYWLWWCLSSWIFSYSKWYLVKKCMSQPKSQKTMSAKMISGLLYRNQKFIRRTIARFHWTQDNRMMSVFSRTKKDDWDSQFDTKRRRTLCILSRRGDRYYWEIHWSVIIKRAIYKNSSFYIKNVCIPRENIYNVSCQVWE